MTRSRSPCPPRPSAAAISLTFSAASWVIEIMLLQRGPKQSSKYNHGFQARQPPAGRSNTFQRTVVAFLRSLPLSPNEKEGADFGNLGSGSRAVDGFRHLPVSSDRRAALRVESSAVDDACETR